MKQLLSDSVDDYLSFRSSQDYRKGTLRNERTALKRLLLVAGNIYTDRLTEKHVIDYFSDAGKTRSPDTLQVDHTVLHQFFAWARETRRLPMDQNPMAFRRRPKRITRERNRLHVTEFANLLDVAEAKNPRDRMMVALLIYLLVRDQEAADLRVGDVNLLDGRIKVRITKSRTEDFMPICTELDTELRKWLTAYSLEIGRPLKPYDYLLPRLRSVNMQRDPIQGHIVSHDLTYEADKSMGRLGRVVKDLLDEIEFPTRDAMGNPLYEGAHTIRRSAARALFDRLAEAGYDKALRYVKEMMHHSTVATTERYIGVIEDRRSRDEVLKGKIMFPVAQDNVVPLSVASENGGQGYQGQSV